MLNNLTARAHVALLSRRHQQGASAVEYGLILGLLAVVFIAGFTVLGDKMGSVFDTIKTALEKVK